jgi:hypothetical protein
MFFYGLMHRYTSCSSGSAERARSALSPYLAYSAPRVPSEWRLFAHPKCPYALYSSSVIQCPSSTGRNQQCRMSDLHRTLPHHSRVCSQFARFMFSWQILTPWTRPFTSWLCTLSTNLYITDCSTKRIQILPWGRARCRYSAVISSHSSLMMYGVCTAAKLHGCMFASRHSPSKYSSSDMSKSWPVTFTVQMRVSHASRFTQFASVQS